IYYTALVTRAYRKRIDEVEGRISADEAAPFVAELDNVAHRQFATGFYFDKNEANKTTKGETSSPWILAGTIGKKVPGTDGDWEFVSMNKITAGIPLEFVGPDEISIPDTDYVLIDPETGTPRDWVCHGHPCIIRTSRPVQERFIVRAPAG
ncbi:MAG: U32 family peptidase, partial [Treponema sp.]